MNKSVFFLLTTLLLNLPAFAQLENLTLADSQIFKKNKIASMLVLLQGMKIGIYDIDKSGLLRAKTASNGDITTFRYNANGQLLEARYYIQKDTIEAADQVNRFTYNAAGENTRVDYFDSKGNQTSSVNISEIKRLIDQKINTPTTNDELTVFYLDSAQQSRTKNEIETNKLNTYTLYRFHGDTVYIELNEKGRATYWYQSIYDENRRLLEQKSVNKDARLHQTHKYIYGDDRLLKRIDLIDAVTGSMDSFTIEYIRY